MMISYFQDIGVAEEKISGTLLIMTVHRGIDGDQIKLIRKWLSREPGGDKGGINASLGLKQTQSYTTLKSEDKAKGIVDLFNMKTLFQDSGSALVERLFDMGSYTPEEKAKMQKKIKNLVEDLLPDDVTVD